MLVDYHRFAIGKVECVSLSDDDWDYPLTNFFANVPVREVQDALRQHGLPIDYLTTPCTHLYVNTGEHCVLVDTGAGHHLAPRAGSLLRSMASAGIAPAQIDTIVITHAHPDHVGGILDKTGQPLYVGARYYMSPEEWNFWFSELSVAKAPERFVSVARQSLEPIRDRVTLVEGESEIVPGIRTIPAPGHTPGHRVVEVSSGEARLFCAGDTALHPLHLEHPDWLPIYDIVPESAADSKRRILDLAAADNVLVMGPHFAPFPGLGTVLKSGNGWKWRSVEPGGAS